jgi:hypothetical protein
VELLLKDFGIFIENCVDKKSIESFLKSISSLEDMDMRFGTYKRLDINDKTVIDKYNYIESIVIETAKNNLNKIGKNIEDYEKCNNIYKIKTWGLDQEIGFHKDSVGVEVTQIKSPAISIVFYLTEDFEGGEIIFPNKDNEYSDEDIVIKPKAGSIIIFHSDITHRVNKLVSGRRIATDLFLSKK